MKRLFTFLMVFTSFYSFSQVIDFPDTNFKARLLSASPDNQIAKNFDNEWVSIDLNDDGEIDVDEAALIKELNVGERIVFFEGIHISNMYEPSIQSVEGIENFINLHTLSVIDEQITQIDLGSMNPFNLYLNLNQLTSIDLTDKVSLSTLFLDNNQLTELDLSSNHNLSWISCNENNLEYLDLSNQSSLSVFQLMNNDLHWLNIKNGSHEILYPPLTDDYDLYSELSYNPNLQYICCDEGEEMMDVSNIQGFNYGIPEDVIYNAYCSFTPGGTFYEIQGTAEFDLLNDGCETDTPDILFPNIKIDISNFEYETSYFGNENGLYYIPIQEGQHTVTPVVENPEFFTVYPTSFTANFPTDESPFTQDICIAANGEHKAMDIQIIPLSLAHPGFETDYKMTYTNTGNQTITFGQIKLMNDFDLMEEVSFNPNWTSFTEADQAWNFNFEDLLPFESRDIYFTFSLNMPTDTPPLNDGDELTFTAQAFIGYETQTPFDVFTLNQAVVNSYDPNDKTCLQGDAISPEMVGEYVHYMIRFENTGSAEAVNIVVKDVVNTDMFDIETLQPVEASHDFVTRIKNGNEVEFIFENINLPYDDENNDGYVVFKIKTLDTLEVGDTFENNAEIYFDYNAPIVTDTAVTSIENMATNDVSSGNAKIQIYPNPATSVLHISAESEIKSVQVYDVNGKLLSQTSFTGNQNQVALHIEKLPQGTYLIKTETHEGIFFEKVLKK